ncbi:hypothetical protein PIROE2DRAFT_8876 [Piromyces sp. E2]|nr:hypothetical protein PIROE2DRAFT_8876 [Piromyces sp. E2]|eukprot:OUM64325.1 hypothetical protein PIROE2DRAFT_8876 [Piromyces sp. E2]
MNIKKSFPAIVGSSYSQFNIDNSTFNNLILTNGLFGDQSNYTINNSHFDKIQNNSKSLLYLLNNDFTITNSIIENISCVGDSGDSAFILYETYDMKTSLIIDHTDIKNCISNGPFIKIFGMSNNFILENSNVSNVVAYGSIIENMSEKSSVKMSNMNFNKNINNNKFDCGTIHFKNNVDFYLYDSFFTHNQCKSYGGAM